MSATATSGAPGAGTIGFGDLLGAELTKIATLPAAGVALALAVAAHSVLGVLGATDAVRIAGPQGPVPIAELGSLLLAPAYAVVAIAVLVAGSEHRGGQLRVSLVAVPDRDRLFAAKLGVAAAAVLLAAVPAVLPGHLVRHAAGVGAGPALAALLAVHLLLGLLGFGLATVARSVVIPLAALVVLPVLVSPVLQAVLPGVVELLPHEAALAVLGAAAPGDLGRTGGLLVLAGWAVLATGTAWAAFTRRDSAGR